MKIENLEIIIKIVLAIFIIFTMILYCGIAIAWSDTDYCRHGISTSTTCNRKNIYYYLQIIQ